ncbi:hypothetical protein GGI07_002834 [Coemansia sp. Benny D115]|nr:hypothetical protein GGI07_002834 [Coemansia sp. Benny D115]
MAGPQTSKRLKLEEEDNKQAPNVLVAYGSDSDQDELADKKVLNKEHTNVVDKNVKPDFSKIEEEEQDIERLIGSIGNETAASTDTLLREMEEFERDISGLDSKNNEKASLNTDGVSESPAVQTFDGSKNSDSGVVVVVDPYSEKGLEMQGEVLQQHIAQLQQVRDLLCQDEDADGVDGAMDVAEGSNPDRSASNSGDDDSDDDDGQEYAEFMTDWRRGML